MYSLGTPHPLYIRKVNIQSGGASPSTTCKGDRDGATVHVPVPRPATPRPKALTPKRDVADGCSIPIPYRDAHRTGGWTDA